MLVSTASIPGVLVFTPTPHADERGFFTRTFDADVARSAGIDPDRFVQDSQSRSRIGVVRGVHTRTGGGEAKLVRCASGRVLDVVVDLRPDSPTFGRHEGFELDDVDHRCVYVPRGCGHAFQALSDPADVCYRIDARHDPAEDLAIRFDDPDIGINWPLSPTFVSDRDRSALTWQQAKSVLLSAGPTAS